MARETDKKRARLIDLARGGDGIVTRTIQELNPPHIVGGEIYRYRIVDPTSARRPENRVYIYLHSEDEAEKLLNIGRLGV